MAIGNTATRIIVSVIAIPLIILAVWFGGFFFLGFVLAIGLAAYYEFALMAGKKNALANMSAGLAACFLLIINGFFHFVRFDQLTGAIVVVLVIFELFRNKNSAILNLGTTLLGIFYIGLFASFIVEIREFFPGNYILGAWMIISLFASIWICDSAAFFVGSAFGRHKMFPRVSPKKSWEGAIAGFIFSLLAMAAAKYSVLTFLSLEDALAIGAITGLIGQIGDLSESLLKRDAGVKDSSALIPGHGGIFDRFDSLLLTAPVVYFYLFNFVKK